MWKLDNVASIKNDRPISLLPVCGKIVSKIIFNNLYTYLHMNNFITKNQSVFLHTISQPTNYYIFLIKSIRLLIALNNSKLELIFLDSSSAFDKVRHDGLIFKLEQNGITGNLLRLNFNII